MGRNSSKAFTLAECVLAMALLAMILLALVGTTISSLRASEKSALLGPATQVSDSLMNRTLYQAGGPLGGAIPNNRVKKVDILVWWWEARSNNGQRQGYGKMQVQASRLVEEHAP